MSNLCHCLAHDEPHEPSIPGCGLTTCGSGSPHWEDCYWKEPDLCDRHEEDYEYEDWYSHPSLTAAERNRSITVIRWF